MLRITVLLASLMILISFGCKSLNKGKPKEDGLIIGTATVKEYIVSRGYYQYLLAIELPNGEELLCWPEPFPEALQVDEIQVAVTGRLMDETIMVKKPGPNDTPVDDFLVRKFFVINVG